MKKDKRIFGILLSVLCLVMLLSGCGKEENTNEKKIVYKKTEVSLSNGVVPAVAAFKGTIVYYVSGDETNEKISTYDIEKKAEKDISISIPKEEKVLSLRCMDSGELIVLTGKGEGTFYLASYDEDNKELWKNEITDKLYDKNTETIVSLETDKDGNIYLLNGLCGLAVWSYGGEFLFKIRSDDYMQGLVRAKDNIYTYLRENNQTVLQEIDIKKQERIKTKYENLPEEYSVNAHALTECEDDSLLVGTQVGLSMYNLKKENSERLVDWASYGLMADEIYASSMQGDNIYLVWASGDSMKLVILSPAEEEEGLIEKEVITINPEGTHGYIQNVVRKFNEQSDKYVVEFAEEKPGNLYKSVELRDIDIMAGKGTDIICMPNDEEYRKYADKGILEDMYPFLDKDEETGREDYLSNILKVYEWDGRLYSVIPSFHISTLSAPTSYVGNKMGLTIEEFQKMVENLPQGKKLSVAFRNKTMTFCILLRYTYPQFIDFKNFTCDFENEEFISWLEFINSIEEEDPEGDATQWDLSEVNQKDYILSISGAALVNDYQRLKTEFGEEVTYIGYPGRDSSGSFVENALPVGIWSQSTHKEGAWEFIKFMLSEQMQDAISTSETGGFPIRISSLEKDYAKAMQPEYETDENGNQVEKPKGEVEMFSGEKIPFYAATEEDIAKMRELIAAIHVGMQYNDTMESIILEEVAAFYEGDKTAEEVAGFIQNRIQLYLNEIK